METSRLTVSILHRGICYVVPCLHQNNILHQNKSVAEYKTIVVFNAFFRKPVLNIFYNFDYCENLDLDFLVLDHLNKEIQRVLFFARLVIC